MKDETCTTQQAASMLGVAVRSVQLMVDRGELDAWKTAGGHRRILRSSIERQLGARGDGSIGRTDWPNGSAASSIETHAEPRSGPPKVLLIEDSKHYQTLIGQLVRQRFPHVDLHTADDGIDGLVMCVQLQPDVLIIDVLLPGMDGAKLISSVRTRPHFSGCNLIVVTSLDEDQRAPYAFALNGLSVVHKPRLVHDLPVYLEAALPAAAPSLS